MVQIRLLKSVQLPLSAGTVWGANSRTSIASLSSHQGTLHKRVAP